VERTGLNSLRYESELDGSLDIYVEYGATGLTVDTGSINAWQPYGDAVTSKELVNIRRNIREAPEALWIACEFPL
jgi:hypothetical protein